MISDYNELIDFIDQLIRKLEDVEEFQWCSAFREALNISFMQGEVLAALRYTMKKFQETELPQQMNIATEIDNAVDNLDTELEPNRKHISN
jgi:hypothetical protein